MSIAEGFHRAVESAAARGMDTMQIFTHSPSQWAIRPPAPLTSQQPGKPPPRNFKHWQARSISCDEVRRFGDAIRATGIQSPFAHTSYLINLASPDLTLWKKSIAALVVDIQRCELLNLRYLVSHPGSYLSSSVDQGLRRVAKALDEAHSQTRGARAQILLEITAGQGTNLGHRFEHLATILDRLSDPDRVAICFDTCHAFAAGYPMSTPRQYEMTMKDLGRLVGLRLVKAVHLNDSKRELGSRVDRHEHIGRGKLGLNAFRYLLNDPRFVHVPMCLETPKGVEKGVDLDVRNLRTLRKLVKNGERKQSRDTSATVRS